MKTTTSWLFRRKYINTYGIPDFECFHDYFIYLHLNPHVLWAHAIGGTVGVIMYPWAIWAAVTRHSWWELVLATFIYYGIGFWSHFTGDGVISQTGKRFFPHPVFFQSYRSVFIIIYGAWTGKFKYEEEAFMAKYPHTLWIFDKDAPRPAHIVFDDAPAAQPAATVSAPEAARQEA